MEKSMWDKMVTPKVQNDVADFWNKCREENDVGDNMVLVLIDIEQSLTLELGRVMNLFIDAVMSQRQMQREYSGKSALEPKMDDESDDTNYKEELIKFIEFVLKEELPHEQSWDYAVELKERLSL